MEEIPSASSSSSFFDISLYVSFTVFFLVGQSSLGRWRSLLVWLFVSTRERDVPLWGRSLKRCYSFNFWGVKEETSEGATICGDFL
eukprot:gene2195-1362_t